MHSLKPVNKLIKSAEENGITYTSLRAAEHAVTKIPAASDLYWKFAPTYYNWRLSRRFEAYEAPIKPCGLLSVDPGNIEYTTGRDVRKGPGRKKNIIDIADGEWDRTGKKFSERQIFKAFKQHFVNGRAWEETKFFDSQVEKLEKKEEHGMVALP